VQDVTDDSAQCIVTTTLCFLITTAQLSSVTWCYDPQIGEGLPC